MGLKLPKAFNYRLSSRQGWIYSGLTGYREGWGGRTVEKQTTVSTNRGVNDVTNMSNVPER